MEAYNINHCFIFYVKRYRIGENFGNQAPTPLMLTCQGIVRDLAREHPEIWTEIERYKKQAKTGREVEDLLVNRRIESFRKSGYRVYKVELCEKEGGLLKSVGLLKRGR